MGMVTSTSQCPGASWHPTEARVPCRPSGPAVQRWPVWISCAGTTDSTFSGRQPWVQWNPPRSQNCSLLIPNPSLTTYSRVSLTLQNCVQKTGTNNAAQREHFQCYQHSKAVLHIVLKGFFSTPIALGKYVLFVADIKNPLYIYIYFLFFWQASWATPSQVSACLWHFNLTILSTVQISRILNILARAEFIY